MYYFVCMYYFLSSSDDPCQELLPEKSLTRKPGYYCIKEHQAFWPGILGSAPTVPTYPPHTNQLSLDLQQPLQLPQAWQYCWHEYLLQNASHGNLPWWQKMGALKSQTFLLEALIDVACHHSLNLDLPAELIKPNRYFIIRNHAWS